MGGASAGRVSFLEEKDSRVLGAGSGVGEGCGATSEGVGNGESDC